MILYETIKSWTSRAGVVRVRNALNPLLWAAGVLTPMSWIAAYAFRDDAILKYVLVALCALPVLATLGSYLYFMFRNPDRLQSEEFVLRQQELLIVSRSGDGPRPIESEGRELPNVAELEPGEGEPS
jgi:hypothetical protein